MRISFGLALILVVFSIGEGHALAAKGAKKAPPKAPAQSMDSGEADPTEKEVSEKKEATVKKKTDEELEQEQKERELALDTKQIKAAREHDRVGVFGNVLIGFGKAPEPGPAAQKYTGKTTAATFMVGGHYELSPELSIGLRIPFTAGSERQVDGLNQSSQVLGTPELIAEYRVALSPFTRLPISFGLGVPVAQGNYDTPTGQRSARMNDFADAASGYRDPELFAPKRLPIVVGVGIEYERKALNVHAATKFVAGVKAGAKAWPPGDPVGNYDVKSVSFRNVTSAGIAYQFLEKPKLYGALDSWFATSAINPVEFESFDNAKKPTRFQVVFEPRIGARFGKISPSVGYIFPIGGRLADSSISGLELHCDVAF
ncbi:MAG: hypothetical protein ABUL62_09650 [Myxococcales bacterium]